MRLWFAGVLLYLLALTAGGQAAAQTHEPVAVKIIAINDFHGNLLSPGNFNGVAVGGVDALAAYVAEMRSRSANSIVVSAGDLIGASPLISALFHDEATIETMNRLGLELNAVGNHEFDKGVDELLRMQNGGCHPIDAANTCKGAVVGTPVPFEGARFQFLAANVVVGATGNTLFPSYAIKTFGAVRVALIGITLRETPTIVTPAGVAGLAFADEADTVNALIAPLRARGVEAIVVLIHQGGAQRTPPDPADINGCVGGIDNADGTPSRVKAIVARLDDAVDVVISGHTHQAYNCMLPNAAGREIRVTSANALGRVVTEIDLSIDPATGEVLRTSAQNTVVDRAAARSASAASIGRIVHEYASLVSLIANRIVGTIAHDVPNIRTPACEIAIGDLIADAQLLATARAGAKIALVDPGGIRTSGFIHDQISGAEKPGEITYGEAFAVQPFGNSLVTMTLSAQQLRAVLEQQFRDCAIDGQPPQTVQRVLIPATGFTFTWDESQPVCQKIISASLTTTDGNESLVEHSVVRNPQKTYRVTVNNFLATGGSGFTVLSQGADRVAGVQDIDALAAYLAAFQPPHLPYDLNAAILRKPRIRRADTAASCQR